MDLKLMPTESKHIDYHLICSAKNNHEEKAYTTLMNKYKSYIYYKMHGMVKNVDDANDLTLEAFGKAFNHLHQYQPKYPFSSWLLRIATNNCIDFIRKKKITTISIDKVISTHRNETVAIQVKSECLNPEEEFIKNQKNGDVRKIVNQLNPVYKELIMMHYFNEWSYAEIAAKRGMPLGTIKAQLFRARVQVSKLLKEGNFKKQDW